MAVSFVAAGTAANGTTTCSPGIPAGVVAGDLLILAVETANQAVTTPSGWTATIAPTGTGTAASTTATRLTVFHKIASGSDTAPACAVTGGDHVIGQIIAMRGVDTTTPIQASASAVKTPTSTTNTAPTVTTTQANQTVVLITCSMVDTATAQTGAATNAALSSITERSDSATTTGNGGGVGIITATKATAGAVGTTAITMGTTTLGESVTLALTTKAGEITTTQTAAATTQSVVLAGPWDTPVLLHLNGTNGSSTFTNSSPTGPSFAAIPGGIAALSTTSPVFGTACLENGASTNTGGIVSSGSISLIGDFSIEGRHFTNNNVFNGALFSIGDFNGTFNPNSIVLRQNSDITNDGKMRLTIGGVEKIVSSTASPNSAFWAYGVFAAGGTIYLTLNGASVGSCPRPAGVLGGDVMYVGAYKDGGSIAGVSSSYGFRIDEVRVTTGLARQSTFPYTVATSEWAYDTGIASGASISVTQTADATSQTVALAHVGSGANVVASQTAVVTSQTASVNNQTPELWTPANLSNTKAWYVSDNPSNTLSGGKLDTIADKAGGGLNAVVDSGYRAKLTTTLNGRTVWSTDSTDRGCFTVASNSLTNNVPGVSLFAVNRLTTTPSLDDHCIVAMDTRMNLERALNSAGDVEYGGRRAAGNSYQNANDATNRGTSWLVVGGVADYVGTRLDISVNGTLTANNTSFQTSGNSDAVNYPFRLGHYVAGLGWLEGETAEVLVIAGALSTTDRQKVEGYLAWQWGLQANLPGGHPYASAPPFDSTSVSAAQTAVVTSQTATVVVRGAVSAAQTAVVTSQTANLANVESISATQTAAATSQTATVAHAALSVSATQTAEATSQTATLGARAVLSAAQTAAVTIQTATLGGVASVSAAQTAVAASQTATLTLASVVSAAQTAVVTSQTATLAARPVIIAAQTAVVTSQGATLVGVASISTSQTAEATSQTASITHAGVANLSATQTAEATSQTATIISTHVVSASQTAAVTSQTATLQLAEAVSAAQVAVVTSQTATLGLVNAISASQTAAVTSQTATVIHLALISAAQTAQVTSQTATLGGVASVNASQTAAATTQGSTLVHNAASVSAAQTAQATSQTANLVGIASISATQTAAATSQTANMAQPGTFAVSANQTAQATSQTATLAAVVSASANQTAQVTGQTATLAAREAISATQTAEATSQSATVIHLGSISANQTAAATSQTATIATVAFAQVSANQTAAATSQTATLAAREAISAAQTAAATSQTATLAVRAVISAAQTAAATSQTANVSHFGGLNANQTTQATSQSASLIHYAAVSAAQTALATSQVATLFVRVGVSAAQVAQATSQSSYLWHQITIEENERTHAVNGENRTTGWIVHEDRGIEEDAQDRVYSGIAHQDRALGFGAQDRLYEGIHAEDREF